MTQFNKSSLTKVNGVSYLIPFILVTSLFFLWGFAHSLLDVLNKHFQEILHISRAQSGLVQFSLYGGYFLMGLPAGLFMKRFGYKKGIILGLLLYAAGAFFFYPATHIQTFWSFLLGLLIIACGLTFLETAANPYVTVLGPHQRAAQRLNFSQSFNGVGWMLGPMVGGLLIFSSGPTAPENQFASLAIPYVGIGIVVLLVAALFWRTHLPEVKEHSHYDGEVTGFATKPLYKYPHFVFAVVAQFIYVAVQTGINSFFINFVTETPLSTGAISNQQASIILSLGGMGLFMAGRFIGSALLTWFKPNRLLALFSGINVLLLALVVAGLGWTSIIALCGSYFFMSLMFPTIFALGIRDLGDHTKKASSFLIMAVAGGAVCPMFMGHIADIYSMSIGFVIPLLGFGAIGMYGLWGYKYKVPKQAVVNV